MLKKIYEFIFIYTASDTGYAVILYTISILYIINNNTHVDFCVKIMLTWNQSTTTSWSSFHWEVGTPSSARLFRKKKILQKKLSN